MAEQLIECKKKKSHGNWAESWNFFKLNVYWASIMKNTFDSQNVVEVFNDTLGDCKHCIK